MKGFVARWIINSFSLLIVANLIKGMAVNSFGSLILAAFILGVLNAIIKPVLTILTLPINILTLGLFTLVINGFMLKVVSSLVVGFSTGGFWTTVFGALLLSIISTILSWFIGDNN